MRHFLNRLGHAGVDDGVVVLAASGEPLQQRRPGRGQDKDRPGPGDQLFHLLCALPVDLENDIEASGQLLFNPGLGRAVEIAKYLGVLQEFRPLQHVAEHLFAHEVVVDPVPLARPPRPGGMGDGNPQPGIALDQGVDQAGFACTGGG